MPSTAQGLIKKSVTIAGHRTSISLEPIFWDALRQEAAKRGKAMNGLIAEIDASRQSNLSSALRVWLYEQALLNTK